MRNFTWIRSWLLVLALNSGAAEPPAQTSSRAAQAKRPAIDLSGEWEFKMDPLDVGRAQKWFEDTVPFERRIRVPGAWNTQGVAFESEE
jgi:beta-galactosidase/beta-glucuronidase